MDIGRHGQGVQMIRAVVIGAAGYTGAETVRWLLGHPSFELVAASSDSDAGSPLSALYPGLMGKSDLSFATHEDALACAGIRVVFLAVPHTVALSMVPTLMQRGIAVIDLSADFRLKDAQEYEQWYQTPHTAKDLLEHAVYGLPEINRATLIESSKAWNNQMSSTKSNKATVLPPLVANPGCYPTASVLAIAPALSAGLVVGEAPIIINALSGVSGAGRKATVTTHFCSASDDLTAYGVTVHRHTPEIIQALSAISGQSVSAVFTPHLVPLKRGMLATAVLPLSPGVGVDIIEKTYAKAYEHEPFVSVLPFGSMPHSSSVRGTNNAQVGIAYDARAQSLVVSCAIDNLGKGAASQAIQNANIIFGLPETEGLDGLGTLV